jgi:hypothetical protein
MRLVDTRRLTGPNHLAPGPLVLVELALEPSEDLGAAVDAYVTELARMHRALGLPLGVDPIVRPHHGGGVFLYYYII